ncbi:hypothetical protein ACMXYX_07740 [Neptuniibacter sp. QD72_48]|uniref:hypothetical protein n=1 Tax=Neptuniibacter sp. QD72_48 TaxID=3398214 RepID=UPI0039F4536C
MESGHITLDSLYQHVNHDPCFQSIDGQGKTGREYAALATKLTSNIPIQQGFYIWGNYEENSLWRTIYLGKASSGKTSSLKARILEELKDERIFMWADSQPNLNNAELMRLALNQYPRKGLDKHFSRALRKKGTTHIIWVSTPDILKDEILNIEADLIETMNPFANSMRPSPSSGLLDITIEVIKRFKSEIHGLR